MLKLLVVVVVVAAAAVDLDTDWAVFKAKYNKKYDPEIEKIRKYTWFENKRIIEEHNEKFKLGLSSYYLDENEYADMINSEFASRMDGMKVEQKQVAGKVLQVHDASLPDSLDWRTKGYVTPVKNQLHCNCSWAFSVTGAVEGQYFKAEKKLISMSESNLVDCTKPYGNHGCSNGTMKNAYMYVLKNGIESETRYPYTPREHPCKATWNDTVYYIEGFNYTPDMGELELQETLATVGPVSAAIDASHPSFKLYKGGIYNEPNCSSTILDHSVLIVGYGTNQSDDYWIVKNSWGTSWGEKGYIRMSRNKNNQCGIASRIIFPDYT